MYKYKYVLLFLFPIVLSAQTNATIFPSLSGDELLEALVQSYKPATSEVLSYGTSRDMLFGSIDRHNNKVACIYTNHEVGLPDGEDPTDYLYQNGSPNGINAEHTFPQSMGAEFGAARSDMHHLFPARVAVNTARGSLPFAEIQDFETDWWYYKNEEHSSIPSSNKDVYSEGTNTHFEPRESKKGDIARAMFYFYTMYQAQADAANATFFASQRNTLCQWHYQDPADEAEVERSERIALVQGGKANPFVLDCTVAARCYCEEHPACPITATYEPVPPTQVQVMPNPTSNYISFNFEEVVFPYALLIIYDARGIACKHLQLSDVETTILLDDIAKGLYFYQIQYPNHAVAQGTFVKL